MNQVTTKYTSFLLPLMYHIYTSKCPGTFYPGDFPCEKIGAKSVPRQAVNLAGTKCFTSETSAANSGTPEKKLRNYFNVGTVPANNYTVLVTNFELPGENLTMYFGH